MARKTKPDLITEAREELGLEVDEDENYDVINERVRTAREAQERAQEAEEERFEDEPTEADVEENFERVCRNCGRPAVTTDDGGGVANPVDFCARCSPSTR